MMGEIQSTIQSFIPFTSRVYFRLVEQHNESFWPWQVPLLAAGVIAVVLAAMRRGNMGIALTGGIWIWVGFSFFHGRYAELVWAGGLLGWIFALQGLALVSCGLFGFFTNWNRALPASWRVVGGCLIASTGLVVYPLLTADRGEDWSLAEAFGIFPAPTAVFTAGLLMATRRGLWLWLLLVMPIIWLLLEAATHWGLSGF